MPNFRIMSRSLIETILRRRFLAILYALFKVHYPFAFTSGVMQPLDPSPGGSLQPFAFTSGVMQPMDPSLGGGPKPFAFTSGDMQPMDPSLGGGLKPSM